MLQSNEAMATEIGKDRTKLHYRLRDGVAVLNDRYRKFFQRKDQRYDFDAKRLYGLDGWYIQWQLRKNPNEPESYENQQTSIGCVTLEHV